LRHLSLPAKRKQPSRKIFHSTPKQLDTLHATW
jgi:hypothetical protein